jgi:hypothetical protein
MDLAQGESMSKYRMTTSEIFQLALFVALFAVTSTGYAGKAQGGESPCDDATVMDLNSSFRGYGNSQDQSLLVQLEIPAAGILRLDVATPGSTPGEPKLDFAGSPCDSAAASESVVIERSATHLVLLAQDSGSHFFRVASQDPRLPLGQVKVRADFVSTAATGPLLTKGGENEDEIEIEPDTILHPGLVESRSLHAKLHELCQGGEVDDHGDSFTCASLLSPGQEMVGEVRNGWGDDGDVFRFILGSSQGLKLRTVAIETTGALDTFGGLYDRSGQRLDHSDGGGNDGNFRIVRTLGPGAYFVRVEGRGGAEGLYTLRVEAY